jgi:hypothetical protein
MPFYVPQPHVDPLDLDKSDEEIMRETEAVCRRDPGFMPLAQWEASMLRRLAEKPMTQTARFRLLQVILPPGKILSAGKGAEAEAVSITIVTHMPVKKGTRVCRPDCGWVELRRSLRPPGRCSHWNSAM